MGFMSGSASFCAGKKCYKVIKPYLCMYLLYGNRTMGFFTYPPAGIFILMYVPACTAATAAACTAAAARVFCLVLGVSNVIGRLSASRPEDLVEREERVLGPPVISGLVTFTICTKQVTGQINILTACTVET